MVPYPADNFGLAAATPPFKPPNALSRQSRFASVRHRGVRMGVNGVTMGRAPCYSALIRLLTEANLRLTPIFGFKASASS